MGNLTIKQIQKSKWNAPVKCWIAFEVSLTFFIKCYDASSKEKITFGFPFSFVDWPTWLLDSGSNLPGMGLSAPNVGPVSCLSGPNVLAPN